MVRRNRYVNLNFNCQGYSIGNKIVGYRARWTEGYKNTAEFVICPKWILARPFIELLPYRHRFSNVEVEEKLIDVLGAASFELIDVDQDDESWTAVFYTDGLCFGGTQDVECELTVSLNEHDRKVDLVLRPNLDRGPLNEFASDMLAVTTWALCKKSQGDSQ